MLTTAAVQKHKPNNLKRRFIRDGAVPSLYLVIQPTGYKSWQMVFGGPDGKLKRLVLGPVDLSGGESEPEHFALGMPLGLVAARQFAMKVNRERAMGHDVYAEYHADKQRRCDIAGEREATRRAKVSVNDFIHFNDVASIDGVSTVYFAAIGSRVIKIGFTADIEERMRYLKRGSPEKVALLAMLPGSRQLEEKFHRALSPARISREFFHAEPVKKFLTKVVTKLLSSQLKVRT